MTVCSRMLYFLPVFMLWGLLTIYIVRAEGELEKRIQTAGEGEREGKNDKGCGN